MEHVGILKLLSADLDRLTTSDSPAIGQLAREARTVLDLRSASAAAPRSSAPTDAATRSRERYQSALKLLQDPILPVRAQGLAELRTLVGESETDPALRPAILDIFIRAIEDDDSFLYLNAVSGLAEVANRHGRDVVGRLATIYAGGDVQAQSWTGESGRHELDRRLRIGEALVQIVDRSADSLSAQGAQRSSV